MPNEPLMQRRIFLLGRYLDPILYFDGNQLGDIRTGRWRLLRLTGLLLLDAASWACGEANGYPRVLVLAGLAGSASSLGILASLRKKSQAERLGF